MLWLGIIYSILPDADVIGFAWGIPYSSPWGHRGFTHSLAFALALALLTAVVIKARANTTRIQALLHTVFLFLCLSSHGFADALTDGGLGVAFFFPFDNQRYFLPWRPVAVSPIGASRFFNQRGLEVIVSEMKSIWLYCLGFSALSLTIHQLVGHRKPKSELKK